MFSRWPVARHRLHVTSADPLPRWPSPLAGCSSADPLAVTAGRLHVTGCTSRQRTRCPAGRHPLAVTRWPSPVGRHPLQCHRFYLRSSADPLHVSGPAGRLLVTFARHRLHVTSADPVAPLAVTGCTSPAGRLLVSGPAGRHRWPVARHRLHVTSADPLPRWPSPAGRHPLQCHRFYLRSSADPLPRWPSPAGRHPLQCHRFYLRSSADPLHVSGPAGRLLVTFARHRLHVTSADPVAPLAVTGCTSPAGRLHVSGPAGRLLVTFARHRLHVTSADPVAPLAVTGCTSPAGRLLVSGPAGRLLVSGPAGRHRWPVARHRLHVTSADPLPRWPSPAGRHPLAVIGCTSRQRTR